MKIALTQGKYAIVDASDYEWLNQWKWYYHKQGQLGYAWRKVHIGIQNGKQICEIIRMHRLIMDNPKGMEIDHINGNGVDNQRSNLRVVTHAQNMLNKRKRSDNTSGYIGVYWHRQNKRWYARIKAGDKSISLKSHATAHDAAMAYNDAAIKYFGKFARLN